jgi:hypothetical protein
MHRPAPLGRMHRSKRGTRSMRVSSVSRITQQYADSGHADKMYARRNCTTDHVCATSDNPHPSEPECMLPLGNVFGAAEATIADCHRGDAATTKLRGVLNRGIRNRTVSRRRLLARRHPDLVSEVQRRVCKTAPSSPEPSRTRGISMRPSAPSNLLCDVNRTRDPLPSQIEEVSRAWGTEMGETSSPGSAHLIRCTVRDGRLRPTSVRRELTPMIEPMLRWMSGSRRCRSSSNLFPIPERAAATARRSRSAKLNALCIAVANVDAPSD